MKLYKTSTCAVIESNGCFYHSPLKQWDDHFTQHDLYTFLKAKLPTLKPLENFLLEKENLLAPIQSQEVWAAGVTYLRSQIARKDESKNAGGSDFYQRVYEATRPELFFKATPHRVVGTHQSVRIRKDSTWDVPEPELTLVISSTGKIMGYTVGNDMSSRSIEGENPLYLPQAKIYNDCCALGPCIYLTDKPLPQNTEIFLEIIRHKKTMFKASVAFTQMKRPLETLVSYLFLDNSFPTGCFLMTGTGIVPPNDFTLAVNDEIFITIEPMGTLHNIVK